MNKPSFLKIFAFVAFVALMIISCWATAESFRLSLQWPLAFMWVFAVILFVLWSFGTKLIVDSFNQRIRVDNRGWRLIGGIILLVIWIVFGITTNTHTLFYRATVKETLNTEIAFVKAKLTELNNGGEANKMIEQEKADFRAKVNNAFEGVTQEILDKNNIGFGTKAKDALQKVIDALGGGVDFEPLPKFANTDQGRRNVLENLRNKKDAFLASKESVYDVRRDNINIGLDKAEIANYINEFNKMQNYLKVNNDKSINNKDFREFLKDAKITLGNSLTKIRDYSDGFISHYPAAKQILSNDYLDNVKSSDGIKQDVISKTQRLENVTTVWGNYFKGMYKGRGFLYFILLGALVDIAGFIFFDIAFAKREEY